MRPVIDRKAVKPFELTEQEMDALVYGGTRPDIHLVPGWVNKALDSVLAKKKGKGC